MQEIRQSFSVSVVSVADSVVSVSVLYKDPDWTVKLETHLTAELSK